MHPKFLPQSDHNYYSEADIFSNEKDRRVNISSDESYGVGMHSHEFWELNIVTRGNGFHYIGEMSIPITAGDVFVIPPNTPHGYWSDTKFFTYYIVFKKDFFEEHYNEFLSVEGFSKLFELEPHLRQVYNKKLFLHLNPKRLEKIINSITHISLLNSQNRAIQASFSSLDLICQLCHYMSSDTDNNILENSHIYSILKILEHIHDNYGEKLTAEKLAELSKMSVPTFNRHFKQTMKQSPMQYLIAYRVKIARKMLSENLYNKTEIAQKCGFYDISHMEKYLKSIP